MLRAALVGFHGALVDHQPLRLALLREVLGEEGLTLEGEEFWSVWVGGDDRACLTAILGRAGREAEDSRLVRLLARLSSYWRRALRGRHHELVPGAASFLRRSAAAGLGLGVVSGGDEEEIRRTLAAGGLDGAFKAVAAAGGPPESGPSPAEYLEALRQLNERAPLPDRLIHPHEVLAVEGTPAGVAAAGAAGLVTAGLAHRCPRRLLTGADLVVDDLAALDPERLGT